jgi:3-hydroxyacyl-CoA dehydrogenase/3a,7a,12a-trihydroxy-5b-cholest-24-enoyl-CoA hydratase
MGEVSSGAQPVLQFEGRSVVITGAGSGLGRAYALEFARRGARVLVNDPGASLDGRASGTPAAVAVAAEITAIGGIAQANTDSVLDGARIVAAAHAAFGGVDVLVNNAGIIRDRSFGKMTEEEWQAVCDVHLTGAWRTTRAAWTHMANSGYGRILFTSSAAALYGNFGQANYGAAKLGVIGLMRTLAREGAGRNIHCNAVAPLAATRFTQALMPAELASRFDPGCVVPLVILLCHAECEENGAVFEAGAGWVAPLRWQRGGGVHFDPGTAFTAETLAACWQQVRQFGPDADYPRSVEDSLRRALAGEA